MSFSFFKAMPLIHHLWLGKPRTQSLESELDIDLMGPVKIAIELENLDLAPRQFFFCDSAHQAYYNKLLSPYKKLYVISIDSFFAAVLKMGDEYEWLKQAIALFNKLKCGEVRERVSAKDLGSLLLLYLNGGYFLDTTVIPGNEPLNLRSYESFQAPLLAEDMPGELLTLKEGACSLVVGECCPLREFDKRCLDLLGIEDEAELEFTGLGVKEVDTYVLFGPKHSSQVKCGIECFVNLFPIVDDCYRKMQAAVSFDELEIAREEYHDMACYLSVTAMTTAYYSGGRKPGKGCWFSELDVKGDQCFRINSGTNTVKYFAGSHCVTEQDLDVDVSLGKTHAVSSFAKPTF